MNHPTPAHTPLPLQGGPGQLDADPIEAPAADGPVPEAAAGRVQALLEEAEAAVVGEEYERVAGLTAEIRSLLGSTPSGDLAQAYNLQAMTHFMHGQYREASAAALHEAAIRETIGDHEGLAKCLNNLGLIHIELGDLPTALEHLTRCFMYIQTCPEPLENLACACQINIGNVHQIMRNAVLAADAYRQGIEAARRAAHVGNEIAGLTGLGLLANDGLEYRDALRSLSQALSLARSHTRRYDEAEILDALGQTYVGLGQHDLALETFGQALWLAEDLGALPSEQNTRFHLARLYVAMGQPEAAVSQFRGALACAERSGSERLALDIHEELGGALQALGRHEAANVHLGAALTLERALKDRSSQEIIQNLTTHLEVERARHQADTYRLLNQTSESARAEAEGLVRARTADLEAAQLDIIERLSIAGEYRDDKTGAHTERVSTYAASLAACLGLPSEEVELIRLAARLHDIGKIGVPDSVLLKTGTLTSEEYSIMKHHTTIGARVLEGGQSALMRLAEEIALTHHERWDGSGYPAGLSGERIPLSGRIVAIADVWDALTTERPYKAAWTREDAWRELSAQAGAQFDPYLVEVFLGMVAGTLNAGTEPPPVAEANHIQAAADAERDLPTHAVQHVTALNDAAWEARRADPLQSVRIAHEAYLISEQHGYAVGQGYALRTLGFHDIGASSFRDALDRFDRAIGIARAAAVPVLERDCLNLLGNVYRSIYNTERAMTCLLQSIELSRTLGDLAGEAHALMNLGVIAASRLKDKQHALSYYQQAYAVLETAANRGGQVACLYSMADAFQELGQFTQAQDYGRRGATLGQNLGDTLHHALSLSVVARALDAQSSHHDAEPVHREALELMRRLDSEMPEPTAWIQLYYGTHLAATGALDEAQAEYERVLAGCTAFDLKELAVLAHQELTQVHKRRGDLEAAMHHLEAERALQQVIFEQEAAEKTRGLMFQYEVERAESEAALYKVRSVELASANVALEQANREKSALVAALQEQSMLLERQLREDSLTGVYNRRHIEQILSREFEDHRAGGQAMSLIMLDVDHFKQVNDTFSHLVGDDVLRRMGALLLATGRSQNSSGRYGGEEFVVVLPDMALVEAVAVAERLRLDVEAHAWQEVAAGLRITVSLGVASSEGLENFERLVGRADEKLYEAKRQRNRVAC
ncbi:diguanylate cyclase (GGDEF)-like protein [Deinococcus metalli]|uniref:Diguanylate cyclase (GGDEF)-like protein n=1 Tax=Deinococcus metalli TaxID=1141878 RepID=A0A7W8NTI5_9DEIO|nr:diguanylate cyclase [Deinococcus metalli]MBB5379158.1 diguanylate cyclase (GGDEF)-like protein [Deinococcus metalli]GHF64568.1 hypothetical protein GCM10017781_45530 [Deinococcus metalli]